MIKIKVLYSIIIIIDIEETVCNTVEVAFHPLTIGYCHKMPGMQNLVCTTALDAA